jgi:hypothetical protein
VWIAVYPDALVGKTVSVISRTPSHITHGEPEDATIIQFLPVFRKVIEKVATDNHATSPKHYHRALPDDIF